MSFDHESATPREHELEEVHERRITRCKSCRARIIWFKTDAGRNMPVDADTVLPEDSEYTPPRHISHFATCPNSEKHRKPR